MARIADRISKLPIFIKLLAVALFLAGTGLTYTADADSGYTVSGVAEVGSAVLSGATISYSGSNGSGSTTTDSNGDYSFTNVPNGSYSLFIDSHSTSTVPHVDATSNNDGLTVNGADVTQNLSFNGATIAVTVRGGTGALASGASVTASVVGSGTFADSSGAFTFPLSGYSIVGNGATASDGVADVPVVANVEYDICATLNGSSGQQCQTETVSSNTSVEIDFPDSYTVSGAVEVGGGAVPDATITYSGANGGGTTATDSEGNYTITNVPNGHYSVFIDASGSSTVPHLDGTSNNDGLTVNGADVTQNLSFNGATIAVTVRGGTGALASGASVTATDVSDSGTFADSSGAFTFPTSNYAVIGRGTTSSSGAVDLPVVSGVEYNICATYADNTVLCALQAATITGDTNVTIEPAPGAPTNLVLTTPSPTNQYPALSWSGISGATFYNVYRSSTLIDTISSNNTSYTDYNAPQGSSSYYVTALNAGGESGPSNTVSVIYDTAQPNISYSLSSQPDSSGWNNSPVTVTFTCTDPTSGVTITSCTSPATISTDGAMQMLTGTATDNAGNTASVFATVSLDETPPTIGTPTLSSPTIAQTTNATLTTSASDATSGVTTGEYYIGSTDPGNGNGIAMTYSSGTLTASLGSSLPAGTYMVNVRAKDEAGNWSATHSVSLTVTPSTGIDTLPVSQVPYGSQTSTTNTENIELGVKFTVSSSTTMTAVKFYRAVADTTGYQVDLWDSSGNLLASGTSDASSPYQTGWITVPLSQSVTLSPGTTYNASYRAPHRQFQYISYAYNASYTSGILTVPASGGVYTNISPSGSNPAAPQMPSTVYQNSSYMVTPVISDTTANAVPQQPPGSLDTSYPSQADELGVKFTPAFDVTDTGVTFYRSYGNPDGYKVHVWDSNGNLLGSGQDTTATGTGWITIPLSSPVSLTGGHTYTASYYSDNNHDNYARNFYTTAQGDNMLSTAVGAGVQVYPSSSTPTYPTNAGDNWDFFVSPVVTWTDTTPPTAPTGVGTSVTVNKVAVSWSQAHDTQGSNTTPATSYTIYRNGTALATVGSGTTSYVDPQVDPGNYTYTVKATDFVGNVSSASSGASATVSQQVLGGNPLGANLLYNASDGGYAGHTVGTKFTTDANGQVAGVQFYLDHAANTSDSVGLWNASGSLQASASLSSGNVGPGWVNVMFASPVSVSANTTYVVGLFTTSHYSSFTYNGFSSSVTHDDLTAPSSFSSGGNGVITYGNSMAFPTSSSQATNYWVSPILNSACSGIVHVSGTLSSNQEWKSGCVYVVDSTVTVPNGVTLTVDPGVIVRYGQGLSPGIQVDSGGTLLANGTAGNPITYTSVNDNSAGTPAAGDYYSAIDMNGGTANVSYGNFKYGDYGIFSDVTSNEGGVYGTGSNLTVTDSSFSNISHQQIYQIDNATLVLKRNMFDVSSSSGHTAIYVSGDADLTGIDLSGSDGNTFTGSGLPAVVSIETSTTGDTSVPSGKPWEVSDESGTVQLMIGHIQVSGTLTVDSGSQLVTSDGSGIIVDGTINLQSGVVVKVNGGTGFVVDTGGALNVSGTSASPDNFTSLNDNSVGTTYRSSNGSPVVGDYTSAINMFGGTAEVSHASFKYATRDIDNSVTTNEGGTSGGGSVLTVTDSTFINSDQGVVQNANGLLLLERNTFSLGSGSGVGYAITALDDADLSHIALSGTDENFFTGSGRNVVVDVNGDVPSHSTWAIDKGGNETLMLSGDASSSVGVNVEDHGTVNLGRGIGIVVKVGTETGFDVQYGGNLVANGDTSASSAVVFTSPNDSTLGGASNGNSSSTGTSGDYSTAIRFETPGSTESADVVDHVEFKYAASAISIGAIGSMVVSNSQFAYNVHAFDADTTTTTNPELGDLAPDCTWPYANAITLKDDYFGTSGAPGESLDLVGYAGAFADNSFSGEGSVLKPYADTITSLIPYIGSISDNTIPFTAFSCNDLVIPVTDVTNVEAATLAPKVGVVNPGFTVNPIWSDTDLKQQ